MIKDGQIVCLQPTSSRFYVPRNLDDVNLKGQILIPKQIHPSWRLYYTPRKGSADSQAVYLGELEGGFLLQYVPPYGHTSVHHHPEQETYHSLYGWSVTAIQSSNESETAIQQLNELPITVQPDFLHTLLTEDSPVLNFLQVSPPKDLDSIKHIHVSQKAVDQFRQKARQLWKINE